MKKKIWIASLLTALSITAVAGGIALTSPKTVVTQAAENWTVGEMDNKYVYGASFEVPSATVEVNGETVQATATVTYPNGLTTTAENVTLNQAGVYTLTYRAVVGNVHCVEEKTFSVENKAYLVQSEKSSVEYGHYSDFGANSDGVLVRLAQGDTLTFAKLLDFDQLKPSDSIVEAFVTPDSRGIYDFSNLIFTLTDPTDSSAYLRFRLRRWSSETNGLRVSYVDVGGNGQSQVGCENGRYKINERGTPIDHTFTATMNKDGKWNTDAVNAVPDEKKFYVTYDHETMEFKTQNKHVAHLNNLEIFETVWQGFPSGKARLSVTADEYSAGTANFCITKVFGQDGEYFANNVLVETDAPIVNVEMSNDEMPNGQVGYAYTIPAATAFDYYSGVCDVRATVYRDYASATPISVSVVDGKFTPTSSGWYTIVYTAKDGLGNTAKETRNVYVAEDLGAIAVELPETKVTEATLGVWVPVEQATYTGDCGISEMKITASLNGESYEITDGFLPELAGEWTVTYTVTDYIGRTGTASYAVNATVGDTLVVLDEIVLPQVFVSDSKYTLPVIYGNEYTGTSVNKHLCDVVVTDKNGDKPYKAGDSFVPSVAENGDMVKVSYQYNGKELKGIEIPAVLVKGEGDKIIAKNYLYGEGFTTTYKDAKNNWFSSGIKIIAEEDTERFGWTFATPQFVNNFAITFEGIASDSNFESLVLTLTDSKNANEQIRIALKVKPSGTTITVGDTSVDNSTVSLAKDGEYTIEYNNCKFTFGGVTVAAEKTTNGEPFTGFSSKLAYVHVDAVNAKKGAAYKLNKIGKSQISRRNLEVFEPDFEIVGDFGGNQSLNATFEIFPAFANDAFAPQTALTMTAIAPDGTILVDKNGVKLENVTPDKSYFVTFSQHGKYQITYRAVEKDWVTENPIEIVKAVFVVDETAPQAKFTNATQTTAKVGDIITMPTLVYQDNITTNEDMTVVRGVYNPLSTLYFFQNSENAIKCSYAGEYKFIVMVLDEFGNMTSLTHTVTVVEK